MSFFGLDLREVVQVLLPVCRIGHLPGIPGQGAEQL